MQLFLGVLNDVYNSSDAAIVQQDPNFANVDLVSLAARIKQSNIDLIDAIQRPLQYPPELAEEAEKFDYLQLSEAQMNQKLSELQAANEKSI